MKGRKGKKATKNAVKNAAAQQSAHHQTYDRQAGEHAAMGSHGSHGDDYLDNEYDDEPIPIPAPSQHAPVKQPAPAGNQPKVAAGTGTNNNTKGVAGGGTGRPS